MTASGAGQGGSRLPLWRRRPTWWPGFKAWARGRAEDAGKGFTDLHDKIKELGPLLVGVVGLLLLVGVTTNDVLPALVRNAPLQMAVVTTLLVGLPLLAVVFSKLYGVPWALSGTLTVAAICLVIFTAAWSPTAATAPSLKVERDANGDIVVTASTTRLQNDEVMYLQIESANQPCSASKRPRYGVTKATTDGSGSMFSASSNGNGTGEASIQYVLARPLVTSPWLCVWARTPQRCGWRPVPFLCIIGNEPLDSYSFIYLN